MTRIQIAQAWTENRRVEGVENQTIVRIRSVAGDEYTLVDGQGVPRLLAVNHANLIVRRCREGGSVETYYLKPDVPDWAEEIEW